ncbi:MAG TPA: DUF6600 domain-containing protein [Acidisarcina sp.]|nr:DUF6600 domain-containing protein [Acidisarcina sp.]
MRHPKFLKLLCSHSYLGRGSHASESFLTFLPAVVLLVLLSLSGYASAGPRKSERQPHMARLSHVDGSVQVLRGDQTEFEQAVPNMPLVEGSRLQTGQDGRAEVQFDNGSIARITPNSSMSLNQIERGLEGASVTQVELLSGLGYFELRSRGGENSLLYSSYTITPVESSATIRMDADAKPAELGVLDGNVHITGGTSLSVDVHAEETIRFDPVDPARYFLVQGVPPQSWDQWNSDRDQALDQQAMKRTEANAAMGNSYSPGWDDLDQYGGWYSVPGYGNVWSPYGAGPGWDPYGSGYWGYYPGSGYMWISGYSWGWLPYRCGNWNYFDMFGWGWMPNNCGLGWYPGSVVIVNGPQGYHPPPRPHPSRAVASNGSGPANRFIRVNRGPQATLIAPEQPDKSQQHARVINGVVIHPLQPQPRLQSPKVETGLRPSSPTGATPGPTAPVQPRPVGSSTRAPYNPAQSGASTATTPRSGAQSSPGMTPVPSPRTVTPMPSRPSVVAPAPPPRAITPAPRPSPPPSYSAPRYSPPPPPPVHFSPPPPMAAPPSAGRVGLGPR